MTRIDLLKLRKVFPGGTVAVRDLDLSIESGELVVLVGPSGCGKSTTLRILAGLEAPSGGEVRFDGERVDDWSPRRRDVAMVFQNYALYPHMNVRDNLAFPLRMRGVGKREARRRAEATAERLGLFELCDRRPRELSGGQQQRVALGRALIREPRVFLLDEPLSNLDAKTRIELREEISRLHRETETTMIHVTHDQSEAMALGDRIAVLDEGRLRQFAPPLELYRRPVDRFVGAFIGSPPMSFHEAEIRPEGTFVEGCAVPGLRLPRPRVLLGLRPRELAVRKPEACDETRPRLRGVVLHLEAQGHETFVRLDCSGHGFTGVADPEGGWKPGDEALLLFPAEGIRCFDPETGNVL